MFSRIRNSSPFTRSTGFAPSGQARAAGLLSAIVLAAFGVAYYFTYEPALEVAITWAEGATWERRMEVERRAGLVRPRDLTRGTVTYDLIDTRPENIRELLEQPEVEDGGVLDRRSYTVPADAPYGRGWMWVGNRWPVVRMYGLVPVIVTACGGVFLVALARELRARRLGVLRLLACLVRPRRAGVEDAGKRFADRGGVRP